MKCPECMLEMNKIQLTRDIILYECRKCWRIRFEVIS